MEFLINMQSFASKVFVYALPCQNINHLCLSDSQVQVQSVRKIDDDRDEKKQTFDYISGKKERKGQKMQTSILKSHRIELCKFDNNNQ